MKAHLLATAIFATSALVSASASALDAATDAEVFEIQESAIPGTGSNIVVANQISGQYDEVFTSTSATTFNTVAIFNAGAFNLNGLPQDSFLNGPGTEGYRLYVLFQADGDFVVNGGVVSFTGNNGTIALYADPNKDTDTTGIIDSAANGGIVTTALNKTLDDLKAAIDSETSTGDDILLGTAETLIFGNGNGTAQAGANGNFELIFDDWSLTDPEGLAYFVQPNPFYMILDVNGNFQSFTPGPTGDVYLLRNSANAFFAEEVPVPGTLAIFGLGLAGLGLSLRRRKA